MTDKVIKQSKPIKIKEKDERPYFKADEINITFEKGGKEIYSLQGQTEKLTTYIDRYKESENRESFGSVVFPNIGRISFWAYTDDPDRVFIGVDRKGQRYFDELDATTVRKLKSILMKIANRKRVVGQYTPERIRKRIKRLMDERDRYKKELQNKLNSEKLSC